MLKVKKDKKTIVKFQPKYYIAISILALTMLSLSSLGAELTLTKNSQAKSVIVVPKGTMQWKTMDLKIDRFGRIKGWKTQEVKKEQLRRLLRNSVKDLAYYLGKIANTKVKIVNNIKDIDNQIPIYIGSDAKTVFGPVGITMAGKFGFRVVVNQKGIGLYGESKYGTSYAIYEFLHQLGCRWYMPSELGECIPKSPTIKVAFQDKKLAPATEYRRLENRVSDSDFRRRNRMNGNVLNASQTLEQYITPEQLKQHPEWRLIVNGKPHPRMFRWTRKDVAEAVAASIIKKLDKNYIPTMTLTPGDCVRPSDDPEEMKADPTPRVWEPAAQQWSVSDRLVLLANRVATIVNKKYPKVKFGLGVYVNYSMPPKRYKVNPNVVPVISPIDFNRMHPMTWPNHPNKYILKDMVEGWAKISSEIGFYGYAMNLAEITAPNPFITKWSIDLPIIMKNKCKYWMPESMAGWESMLPGYYLSIRIPFYPKENPKEILNEMMTKFYGHAAEPMKKYWYFIDHCWVDTNEYAGAAFGYLKMFTPERMKKARGFIDQALAKCQTITEYKRVKLIDQSFSLFEQFMSMREDFANAGRWQLAGLSKKLANWEASLCYLRNAYKKQYCFDSGLAKNYIESYFGKPYREASKIMKNGVMIGRASLDWKYHFDKDKKAESLGWTKPDFDDKKWKTTNVVRDTWSSLGFHNAMGRMVYRTNMSYYGAPAGKKVYLWVGSSDGKIKLFINGKQIPYVVETDSRRHKKGEVLDEFSGFCQPAKFDITKAIKKGKNQITIFGERTWLNELGSGGLMGPVVMFRDR